MSRFPFKGLGSNGQFQDQNVGISLCFKMYLKYSFIVISLSLSCSAMQHALSIFTLTKLIQKQKFKILKFEFSTGVYFWRSDDSV